MRGWGRAVYLDSMGRPLSAEPIPGSTAEAVLEIAQESSGSELPSLSLIGEQLGVSKQRVHQILVRWLGDDYRADLQGP